jgi:hypothetical protein
MEAECASERLSKAEEEIEVACLANMRLAVRDRK